MGRCLLAATIIAATLVTLPAQRTRDWPQLYGPVRNGTAAMAIPAGASLAIAWKKPLPGGGSGFAVAGGHAYTLGTDGEQDVLFALHSATGEESWRVVLGETHPDAITNGPNSTPAFADNVVLAVSTLCRLQAVSTATKQIVWVQDLAATYSSRFAKRGGCGMSPLIAGSRVVIVTGAAQGPQLAAFDIASGKPSWTATLPNSFNVSPGWMASADGSFILYHHNRPPAGISGITAVNSETGEIAWQIEGVNGDSNVTPVPVDGGRVLLETWAHVTAYDVATRRPLWTSREIAALGSPAIVHQGHVYTFGGQSGEFLTCVDVESGTTRWTSRIYRGHLARAGDTLVVLSESSGLLRLVAADPSAYRELAKIEVLAPGARTATPPSIAQGRIFVRNLEEVVAVGVR